MFKITYKGNAYTFDTFEDAANWANDMYMSAGIIVGIEEA